MSKSTPLLLSVLLLSASVLPFASAHADDETAAPAAQTSGQDPYAVTSFTADFKRFTIGDIVPELYRSKTYEIDQWQLRHLPAPEADSHWTYMGGDYVLITNAEGKVLRAEEGNIFYEH
ncbi:RcnB family protein [Mangrovibacter plantisponsor]|uniref:Ni/Co efflux regulator RcnB n=1 Tax=Mangrovibacter plantisponsor TaxID=451513 RepID=A0A317Q7N9_9ENTR|nr:RcnB family protein [Mangrovibacter plantisponsor]PWW12591.1 Ni/Co efflux regulator RcnB [Mangrovibacter plantisponsor]